MLQPTKIYDVRPMYTRTKRKQSIQLYVIKLYRE